MSLKEDEKKLDTEFERMGLAIFTYHFTKDVDPFRAITIATINQEISILGGAVKLYSMDGYKGQIDAARANIHVGNHGNETSAQYMLNYFNSAENGVAVCSMKDNFDRRKGRVIAKGRLLKHLKEQQE